tara:strand:- start:590 stop:979 length:390 start_codon:yes stop_codon:yes gene_type:complete
MALFSLLSPLTGIAKTVTESVVEGRKLKQELKNSEVKAKIKQQELMAEGKIKWENQAQKNLETSYKDEVVLAILLAPCLCAFYPPAVEHIKVGFSVLEDLPEWYMWLLFAGLSSAIGYRGVDKLMKFKK